MTRPLLIATRSSHKLREIRAIVEAHGGPRVVDLDEAGVAPSAEEEDIEVHDSFAGNAAAKAHYYARRSGLPALADDSGLVVDALGGEPGVRSRRFSGRDDLEGEALDEANNQLLLRRLLGVPREQRTAHYVCVAAIVGAAGDEVLFEGRCDGLILEAPRGSGGFGYDPLFWVPSEQASFGEIDPVRKNRISHRARAMTAAARALAAGSVRLGAEQPPR